MKSLERSRRITIISILFVAVNEILFCVAVAEKNRLDVRLHFALAEILMFTIMAFCIKRYNSAIVLLCILMLVRLIFILRSDFMIYYSVGFVGTINIYIAVLLSISVVILTGNLILAVILKHRTKNMIPRV